jgi:hypothetical protein
VTTRKQEFRPATSMLAIRNDEELNQLLSKITIASAGCYAAYSQSVAWSWKIQEGRNKLD